MCLQFGRIRLQLGVLLGVNLATGRDDRERHQDVRSCERSTAKILAIVRRSRELRVQETEVGFVVCVQVHCVDLVGNASRDRLNEEGYWRVADVWMECLGQCCFVIPIVRE